MYYMENFFENEVVELQDDIEEIEAMTEEEMQMKYNTDDTKSDFLVFLKSELEIARKKLSGFIEDDYETVDCGFSSESDYLRYKFG